MRAKSKSRIYFDAALARAIEIIRKEHPEVVVNEPNVVFVNVPCSWNNGKPARFGPGPICSLEISGDGVRETTSKVGNQAIEEVFVAKKEISRINNAPTGLIVILFGLDRALTFSRLKPAESYRISKYDRFALPVKDFAYLTTIDAFVP